MRNGDVWLKAAACIFAAAALFSTSMAADEAAKDETKPSAYAPAKDLEAQLADFIEKVEEALSEEEEYGEEQQQTVARNAATISAIGLVLAMHDEESDLKPAGGALIAAGEKLAAGVADFAAAKAALGEIQAIVESPAEGDKVESWRPAGDLAQHMKQVPIVNNNLRLAVTGRRFDRTLDRSAGLAASLATLAQVSRADTTYCADEEAIQEWQAICDKMRDASSEVRTAVRAKDQAAATKALDAIVVTCDECHHKFRD